MVALSSVLRETGRRLAPAVVVGAAAWAWWLRGSRRREAAIDGLVVAARRDERARYCRLLHDGPLQVVEVLAVSPEIRDEELRELLAHEASSLRRLIQEGVSEPGHDLVEALRICARRVYLPGIEVVLRAPSRCPAPGISPAAVRAVTEAVREALTNVRKHAKGATRVEITAGGGHGWAMVVIADNGVSAGTGRTIRPGFGISQSIGGRMSLIGGGAVVRRGAAGGTVVELRFPVGQG